MKVAINACYGGFSLSALATKRLAELKGRKAFFFTMMGEYKPVSVEEVGDNFFFCFDREDAVEYIGLNKSPCNNERFVECVIDNGREILRNDKDLIRVIEELGSEKASGKCAELKIIEIPDDVNYEVEEYDGNEHVAEKHRTWG